MTSDIYPPDYASPVGQVRNLCNDTIQYVDPANPSDPASYLFEDSRIEAFLTLNNGNVRFAAADIVDALADNEILISKKIRTEDLQTDGAAVGNALRLHATSLRAQAKQEIAGLEDEGGMEIVDFNYQPDLQPWRYPKWF